MTIAEVVPANGAVKTNQPLLTPYKLAEFNLNHRIVYAPLTRCRAIGKVPHESAIKYYADRTTPGALMISEGTPISETGHGYPHTPGVHNQEQIEAWKPITQAVKDKGGVFFCQIWHVGRASDQSYQPNEALPISSSATAIKSMQLFSMKTYTMADYPVPRALEAEEIPAIVDEFRQAARNALEAGFDGVEIHGANGYLIDQFLKDEINNRIDQYGGSIENRCRFALEVIKAVVEEAGANRVGIRLSPFGGFLDATDSHPYALISYLLEELNKIGLAYVHLIEPRSAGNADVETTESLAPFRKVWKGTLIAAGGYKPDDANEAVASGHADLIAIGRDYLSNPDYVKRVMLGAPRNAYDRDTFYSQEQTGYNDYPFLEDTEWGKANADLVANAKLPSFT